MRVQLFVRKSIVGTRVFVHAFARRVVFVEVHARATICTYIDCWHTCVFVHAFAQTVVYVYNVWS